MNSFLISKAEIIDRYLMADYKNLIGTKVHKKVRLKLLKMNEQDFIMSVNKTGIKFVPAIKNRYLIW